MGLFDGVKKLLAGETISFEKTTHVNLAADRLTADRQGYIGRWRGPNTDLVIQPDGTVTYRHAETVEDTTRSDSVSGPIDSFDGASFLVGILGKNRRFEVTEAPHPGDDGRMTMTVDGEQLHHD